jgi:hypothetical protein
LVNLDDICKLFVDTVPDIDYNGIQPLASVNFRQVSTASLLQMREVATADASPLLLPFIAELVENSRRSHNAVEHEFMIIIKRELANDVEMENASLESADFQKSTVSGMTGVALFAEHRDVNLTTCMSSIMTGIAIFAGNLSRPE